MKYVLIVCVLFAFGCLEEVDDTCEPDAVGDAGCVNGQSYCLSDQIANYCNGVVPGTWGEADCAFACRDEGGGCCAPFMDGSGQDGCMCCDKCAALGYPCL